LDIKSLCVEGSGLSSKTNVHEKVGFCLNFASFQFSKRCLSVIYKKTDGDRRARM